MSRHTPIDKFTLPKDIPAETHADIPSGVAVDIPSPTDPRWEQPGGFDPLAEAEEARRGYVMRSRAGRGWAPVEEPEPEIVMVEGLPHTPEDMALRRGEAGADGASAAAPDTSGLVPLRAGDAPGASGPQPLLTPERQAAFARVLAEHGNVRLACRAVGVSAQTAYRARRSSRAFRACWDAALLLARDHAEQVLADRALNGVEEKVFYHGEVVATRTRYSDRLLLAHLERLDRKAGAQEACDDCDAPLLAEEDFDGAVDALEAGEVEGEYFAPGQCSMCSRFQAEELRGAGERAAAARHAERLRAMEAALPADAQELSGLGDEEWRAAEGARLDAYERCEEEWWMAGAR
ncbi:hypothetical protein [Aurantiacibacter poecillastricola]|uniref:hypothetical protein n=1 Tax=Aurantiacibacter poecillastricola TaxID=3064385 RepID=UPI00273EF120|nr:hypothetical protein [Aurantiacibacter sp. 219JJ12-13]MDP5261664.1 hypothetical protein [Aurantiacibacter sp. 219JJ12-13]